MIFGSVCSGIEAASVAWEPLGWRAVWFAEIDPFCCALLKERYPGVPNLGDFTRIERCEPVDLLVGGTPCQSFSVAGLRAGLADDRGNLALQFLALAGRLRPRWVVWENVPGVLSSVSHDAPDLCPPPPPLDLECDGAEMDSEDEYDSEELHAFNCFLAGLSELGYGFAYRVLDAEFFGVPQRRDRVFVVGYLGDWRRAAAVLFERASLSGDTAPRRKAGENIAGTLGGSSQSGGFRTTDLDNSGVFISGRYWDGDEIADTLDASIGAKQQAIPERRRFQAMITGTLTESSRGRALGQENETDMLVTHGLRADGFDASEDGTGRGTPLIPIDLRQTSRGDKMTNNRVHGSGGAPGHGVGNTGDPAFTVTERGQAVAFNLRGRDGGSQAEVTDVASLRASSGGSSRTYVGVRRLTPRECERLQGFPDDYTAITYRGKPAADSPRYKALGNSMAVPVMRWIGARIQMVENGNPAA